MEPKLKHLEMIQGVVNRMATNSFTFKGWAVTIIAGLSAFAAKDSDKKLLFIALFATLLFWAIDAYYLSLERCYRQLYIRVSRIDPANVDFNMSLHDRSIGASWVKAALSPILLTFYGSASVIVIVAAALTRGGK